MPVGLDSPGRRFVFSPAFLVGSALGDETLFSAGKLDLIGEFVLRNGPFLCHGQGAPLEGGLVCRLLHTFPRGGLQGLLQFGRGGDPGHSNRGHLQADFGEGLIPAETVGHERS